MATECKNSRFYWLMKIKYIIIATFAGLTMSQFAHSQEPEQMDIYERAEAEADRLQRVLELEDWQTFYVDSTLKHDLPAMLKEWEDLRDSKVSNSTFYYMVQDKWMEKIDASYKKIFNEEQWNVYMKSGGAKAQKARDKRKAKNGK